MKTIRLFAFAVPAVALMGAAAVQAAEPSCKDNLAEVQKAWDRVYHRESSGAHPQVKDQFRIGKELCAQGKSAEATSYLDVVRSHLGMPVVSKSEGARPVDTLHSDGPSQHHDPKTTPAMGSKAGPAAKDIKPDGASAPNLK